MKFVCCLGVHVNSNKDGFHNGQSMEFGMVEVRYRSYLVDALENTQANRIAVINYNIRGRQTFRYFLFTLHVNFFSMTIRQYMFQRRFKLVVFVYLWNRVRIPSHQFTPVLTNVKKQKQIF